MEYKNESEGYGHTGQYSAVPPSYGYHTKMKSVWRTLLHRHSFEDSMLEKLYKIFVYKLQLTSLKCLLVIAIIITTLLCVFNFVFVSGITLENTFYIILCILFVCVLIFLHTRFMKVTRLTVVSVLVLFLYVCFAVISLPINFSSRPYKHFSPADGLWPVLFTIFVIYVLLPLRIFVAFIVGFLLSVLHTLVAIFLTETYEWLLWRQITANILLFVFVHLVGLFVYDKTEHAQRKVFSEARSCIAARIEAEDENDKLEKLLCTILPQPTAKEVKRDLLSVEQQNDVLFKTYIQTVDNVSLLYANVIGLTELSSQCTASELVKILNHVFAKFDGLAGENHCVRYRIIGDVYFCTSGLPEARPDHAKCCVDLAIDLIDILREIREGTELELYAKIGIHSGNVACGIVGSHRWNFDMFGHDVQLAKEVMLACMPGKVLISKHTFEYLQGEYDVEPANLWNRNEYLRECKMETFFVIPGVRRQPIGIFRSNSQLVLPSQNRHSFRNMSGVITKLMEGLVPSAEVPFLPIAQGPEMERIEKDESVYQSTRSVSSVMLDKVQRYLTQSVRNGTIEKSKSDWVNLFTLVYHHAYKEKRYNKQEDLSFSTTMLCSLMLLVLVAAVQAIVLPRTLLLLLLFLLCFTWISIVLIIFLGAKLRCIDCDFQRSLAVRLIIVIVTAFLMYAVGQINVFCCKGGYFFPNGNVTADTIIAFNRDFHLSCDIPQYLYISGIMAILTMAIYVKLAAWLKLVLMLVMAGGYVVLVEVTHRNLLKMVDVRNHPDLPHHLQGLLSVLILVIAVYIQARLLEWTLRLGFLWKDQAMDERIAVTEFQNHVRLVVMSMLPSHVATHFVDFTGLKHSLDLYGHSYNKVGLCCTSVPNFLDHFRGNVSFGNVNNNNNDQLRGTEALKTLHELVTSFDELLSEDRFGDLDKVRSFGQGYQVAVGLAPERPILETTDSVSHHLTLLVEFVYAMAEKLHSFNEDHGTAFKIRAGIAMGPVTLGVIGARRPQFDIWGYTMYLANLMEASGKPDVIQVTEESVPPLASRYEFQPRSPMYLNGRGELKPYFITGRKFSNMPTQPSFSGHYPLTKRLSNDVPFSGINRPHDPSILGLKTGSAERARGTHGSMGSRVSTGERSFESLQTLQGTQKDQKGSYTAESPLSQRSFNNAVHRQNSNESTGQGSGYAIRIAAMSRSRVPSDDVIQTASKSTMTPPSSLSRKRRDSVGNTHGSLTKTHQIITTGSGNTLAAPVVESIQNRMASPDLPLVHYQRQGSGGNLQGENTSSFTRNNILTQSQILNPERDGGGSSSSNSNKSQNLSPSHSGANLQSNNVVHRRSSTQTPSSNRSSAETIGSVASVHLDSPSQQGLISTVNEQAVYNTPPRTKPLAAAHVNNSYAVNLPKIEESNRENKSFSSKDSLDELEDSSRHSKVSLGDRFFDATGNEIAEMDQILRELGCTSAAQLASRKFQQTQKQNADVRNNQMSNLNDLNVSSPRGSQAPNQSSLSNVHNVNEPLSDDAHTKTMSSEHGTQISEYENDDSLRIPSKRSDTKITPKVSLLQKRNSLPDDVPVSKDQSQLKCPARGQSLPKDESSHSISTQTSACAAKPSRIPTKPLKRDHVYRPLYSKHVGNINDDSSSTSSSIYGVPKMHKVKVEKPEADDQEDSPPPLPPPPSESAMMGLDKRIARAPPHLHNMRHPLHHPQYQPRQMNPHHRQMLFNNSAFRPVTPNRMRGYPNMMPVMRGPNMGFIGRMHHIRPSGIRPGLAKSRNSKHHDVLSSNTSEENAAIIPRRKPRGAYANQVNISQRSDQMSDNQNKQKSKIPKLLSAKSFDDKNRKPKPIEVKKKERHHSEGEVLEDSTDDTIGGAGTKEANPVKPRVPAPPFQVKRRQQHRQPIRRCRSLDYIPSDLEDMMSVSSRAESPACDYSTERNESYMPITELIKSHIIGDNISLSSLESGSEMSRSEPDLNYDSSTTAYESEYDNYRPGMASDEDYFVPEPISDVELGMFDDINLEDVTISDQYNIDMADFLNKNRKVITDV